MELSSRDKGEVCISQSRNCSGKGEAVCLGPGEKPKRLLGQKASLGEVKEMIKLGERAWESAPRAPSAILIAFGLRPQNTAASSGVKLE